ncbi:MAG: hypothetical protein ACE5J4_01090 [Candidatus Aenigmatarchaeota archaeon]
MRYLLFLIIGIIIISLCVETDVYESSVIFEETTNPDLYLKVEAIPSVVKSGRNLDILFEINNKQGYDLKNFNLNVYDQCVFSGNNSKSFDEIKANRTERWHWKWLTGTMEFERDCEIRFRTEFETKFSLSKGIAVLQESEYYQRESAGTLQDIIVQTDSTDSPVKISLSFSEPHPFLDEDSFYMYIDYTNEENGYIEKLESYKKLNDWKVIKEGSPESSYNIFIGYEITNISWYIEESSYGSYKIQFYGQNDKLIKTYNSPWYAGAISHNYYNDFGKKTYVKYAKLTLLQGGNPRLNKKNSYVSLRPVYFTIPSNIEYITCSDYERIGNTMYLKKDLKFFNNRASRSTCNLKVKASQPIDIQSITLTANYKYMLDNSITVKVKPK